MLLRGGLWLFMVACVGAYDYYDGRGQTDYKDEILPDDSNDELKLEQLTKMITLNDLTAYKLIKSLQDIIDGELRRGYRPKLLAEESRRQIWPQSSSEGELNGVIMKKLFPETKATTVVKSKSVPSPQRKWRIKRPPKICLLKLCGPIIKYSYY